MSILDNYYSLFPISMGILNFIWALYKWFQIEKSLTPVTISIHWAWLFGIIALLTGFLGTVLWMTQTFDAISNTDYMSPQFVAQNIKVSFYSIIYGIIVFIFSLIIWGVLNGKRNRLADLKI